MIPAWVPNWAKDLVWAFLGPIISMVQNLLGIVDNIEDFIEDLLGNTFNLLGLIETAVADYFANQYPIYEFEDPYPVLPASGGLIPVKIPLRNLTAAVDSQEMVVLADVETAVVKRAIDYNAAECYPEMARERIREAVRAALGRLSDFQPYRFEAPTMLEFECVWHSHAALLAHRRWRSTRPAALSCRTLPERRSG